MSLEDTRRIQYLEYRKIADELQAQNFGSQKTRDVTIESIKTYLCGKIDMFFYSNPFDDSKIPDSKEQQDLTFNMACEAFEYQDSEANNKKLIGIHYYLPEEVSLRGQGMEKILNEDLKDMYFINRTEFDKQQFKINFDPELEYMNVAKSLMFQREQHVYDDVADIPSITNQEEYDTFRSEGISILLYESEPQILTLQKMEGTVIESTPQMNYHYNLPNNEALKVFGLPVIFQDRQEDLFLFDQVFDLRQASPVDSDDLTPLTNTVDLRFTFTKKTFEFHYFTLLDLFSDLGGIGSGLGAIIQKYYIYIVLLFAIQLNMIIKTKHNQDFKKQEYKLKMQHLPSIKNYLISEKERIIKANQPKEAERLVQIEIKNKQRAKEIEEIESENKKAMKEGLPIKDIPDYNTYKHIVEDL